MSEPNYFPAPGNTGAIGQGGIGKDFQVGQPPFSWQLTALSQYANSPKLLALIASFAEAMDQQANIDAFYDQVWNVATAEGWGLDVWGRIVVVSRTLQVSSRFFGFEEGTPDYDPFNTSPYFSGGATTSSFTLSDDAYRVLIIAKAAANICDGSVPGINAILQILFPNRGPCYVTDNQDMTMTYTFGFAPTPVELAIIETSNVLPRPSGVAVHFNVMG
jgi:hypothetical protein